MTTPSFPVFSKSPRRGQLSRGGHAPAVGSAVVLLAACAVDAAPKPTTPSGEPVPRYATLKAAPVNARGGPGEDYKALWRYTARGLPLQIVEETPDWRRVCDPEGGLAWVKRTAVDPRHTVMRTAASDLAIRARPSEDSRTVAVLASRATAELTGAKGDWRRITVDHVSGWVRAGDIWGGADAVQCRSR